jgi:hypothetical protein
MGWRERLGVGQSSSRPSVRSSWPTGMEARGSKIDIVRAATVAAAGEPIDVSYITEALVAQEHDAPFHEDVPGLLPELYGEDANAVIALYGGPPIESTGDPARPGSAHCCIQFGWQAAQVAERGWLRKAAEYKNGNWVYFDTVVYGSGEAKLIAHRDDGAPLWEFRL